MRGDRRQEFQDELTHRLRLELRYYLAPVASIQCGKDGKMEREVGFQAGVNQQFWLAPVIDRLLLGGICMALVYDWAKTGAFGGDPTHLLDELFDQSGPAWQRKLSFQRAYDFTWYDIGRQQPYIQFHNNLWV